MFQKSLLLFSIWREYFYFYKTLSVSLFPFLNFLTHRHKIDTKLDKFFCLILILNIIEWQSGYQEKKYQSISSSCTSVWCSREIYFQTWGSGGSSSLLQVRKNILTRPSFVRALICALLIKSILVIWVHYQLPPKLRLISQPSLLQ